MAGTVAGQHVDLRLTAENAYQTERSYSIGSPPEQSTVKLTVERIDDGEVSPYLTEELRVGDELELRGPIGGYFQWRSENGAPVAADRRGLRPRTADGDAPHRTATSSTVDTRLLLSARSLEDAPYREELGTLAAGDGLAVHDTLTREPPADWDGLARRIDAEMLTMVGPAPIRRPRIYVCGPTAFVERAANLLVAVSHAPAAIRTERFGPTG